MAKKRRGFYPKTPDYFIRYDPKLDTPETIFQKILYSTIVRRIKFRKPTIINIIGQSGEGKSFTVLYIMQQYLKMQGIDIRDYYDDVNIHNQEEYAAKIEKLLTDKSLKKVNCVGVHEGRESMDAAEWRGLFNRNLAHVNALARSIKRMAIFIISQSMADITKDIRRTLNYQIKIERPLMQGRSGNARLFWSVLYTDDFDLENIKLKRRPLFGVLILPNGKKILHKPKYISIPKISPELAELFEEKDKNAKLKILTQKLEEMKEEIKRKHKGINQKVDSLIEFYTKNDEARQLVTKTTPKGHYRVTKDFIKAHDLTPNQKKEFETRLKEALEAKNELSLRTEF